MPLIRLAKPDDADAVGSLHTRCWQVAYRGILPDAHLDAMQIENCVNHHREWIGNPDRPDLRHWVAEEDGEVRGFAMTGATRDEDLGDSSHELYAIYAAPEALGGGYGRTLMLHLLDDLQTRGFEEVILWYLADNERARRFYEKAGFVPDERVEAVPFKDFDALKSRLRRPL